MNADNLRIYICTWNVNTKSPSFSLKDLIKFEKGDNQPDLCLFGFQEINSKPIQRILDYIFNDPWTNQLTDLLVEYDYVRLESTRLVGNLLNVFIKRSLLPLVRCCSDAWIRLGFWGCWGNKGANMYTINLGNANICFVNSHLSAHVYNEKKRMMEHSKILYHTYYFGNNKETVSNQDYLFFFGDLNFRLENISIEKVKESIDKKDYSYLLGFDQLRQSIEKEKCFAFFQEETITFPPTFKFDVNSNNYDTSRKKRVPAWCDRILVKTNDRNRNLNLSCKPLEYNYISSLNQSDHKPVYGFFKINHQEVRKYNVSFTSIKPNKEKDLEIIYRVDKSVCTHPNDWIAIYNTKFKTSNDYLYYEWAPRVRQLEVNKFKKDIAVSTVEDYIEKNLVINQYHLRNGTFVIGYFSYVSNQLIGLSKNFDVIFS